ncbi:MAG: hypothetical protein V1917_03090 [Candidatus Gottesmanbacteria bacterium]
MTPEIPSSVIIGKMMEFINISPQNGVNRFRLEGDHAKTAYVDTVTGLFQFNRTSFSKISLQIYLDQPKQHTELECYSKIIHLTIPHKLELYPQDEELEGKYRYQHIRNGLPIAALLFGNERDPLDGHVTESPFIQLCVIRGISPVAALKDMQTIAQLYLAKNN